jgi:predicted metal-binding membrane protein
VIEQAMTVSADSGMLEAVLRRDRLVVAAAIVAIAAIAWTWILLGAGTGMSAMAMAGGAGMAGMVMRPAVWTPGYAALMFAMWWVMMVAMMLPSATPMLLVFARMNRVARAAERPYAPSGAFAMGYLVVWGGFSALATLLQWGLEYLGLLSPMMASTSYWLGGAILGAAGLWQVTPIKSVCLSHCRSPIGFLITSWRPGRLGAFRMGFAHGAFCLGCCWFLMGLLFFGGVMNLFWIAGLALFVLLEKTVPMGLRVARIAGVAVAAWGMLLLVTATLQTLAAAPNDYQFRVVKVQPAGPSKTTLTVGLVHVPDKRPVAGADIVEAKTDMGPSGMAEMSGKITPLPSGRPGVYRFLVETGMAGKWRLILGAKVPGETAVVRGVVTYDAAQ